MFVAYPRQRRQRRQCLSATSPRYPPFSSSSSSCCAHSADCSSRGWEWTRILSASSSDPSLPSDRSWEPCGWAAAAGGEGCPAASTGSASSAVCRSSRSSPRSCGRCCRRRAAAGSRACTAPGCATVAAGAFVRLETTSARGCKGSRRRRGCCGGGRGGGNDGGGFARGATGSRGRKTAGLVDCARAAVEVTERHALCWCFEPR